MVSSLFFRSKSGFNYLYSSEKKRILLSHPLLEYLAELRGKGIDIPAWLNNLGKKGLTLEKYGTFSLEEIVYYYSKYLYLEEKGYFSGTDLKKRLSGRLQPDQVKSALATTESIVFEVTEVCNLNCSYCAYGELYDKHGERNRRHLDVQTAFSFMDYLYRLRRAEGINEPHKAQIGFYGGEPLLRFPFIESVVEFVNRNKKKYCMEPSYNMTSNGILLDKYMDFLVENNFRVTISLDGNTGNNEHRIFPDGTSSFEKVYGNISALKQKHSEYFKTNVRFNSVLHSKNSVYEIYRYFKDNFDSIARFSEMGDLWVRKSKREQFLEIYRNANDSIKQISTEKNSDYKKMEKDMFFELPNITNLILFIQRYSGSLFSSYNDFFGDDNPARKPTGACTPFKKKVLIAANGDIFPCEQVGRLFPLGHCGSEKVSVDFNQVAAIVNGLYDKAKACNNCYVGDSCEHCIYMMMEKPERFHCWQCMDEEKFSKYLDAATSALEKRPELYTKVLSEVEYV